MIIIMYFHLHKQFILKIKCLIYSTLLTDFTEQQMIRLDSMLASEGITRPENPTIFPNVSYLLQVHILCILKNAFIKLIRNLNI